MSPEAKQRASAAFAAMAHTSTETAHTIRRWYKWAFALFVDDWHGLSLNRFLAVLFGIAATSGVFQHPRLALTGWDVAMATLAGSLAFGKDIFLAFLNRHREEDVK